MSKTQGLIIGGIVAAALFAVMANKARAAPPPPQEWCCDGTGLIDGVPETEPQCFTRESAYLQHLIDCHSVTVTGTVKDTAGNPISGAIVKVYDGIYSQVLYTYGSTDGSGQYSIPVIKDTYYVIVAECANYYLPQFDPYNYKHFVTAADHHWDIMLTYSPPGEPITLCCDICALYGDSYCVTKPTQPEAAAAISAHKALQHTMSISGNILNTSGQLLNGYEVTVQLLDIVFGKGPSIVFNAGSYLFGKLIPYGTGYQINASVGGYQGWSYILQPPEMTAGVNKKDIILTPSDATWCCPVCVPTQCFMTWDLLQNHIANTHLTTVCQYCGQGPFTDLYAHIIGQHPKGASLEVAVQDSKSGRSLYGSQSNPLLVCFDLKPDPLPAGTGWGKRCISVSSVDYYSVPDLHYDTYYILTATFAGYADYYAVIKVNQVEQLVTVAMTYLLTDNYLAGTVFTLGQMPIGNATVACQGKTTMTDPQTGKYELHGLTQGSHIRVDVSAPGYTPNYYYANIGPGANHLDGWLA
jgi:hypothetical protein